MSFSGLALRPPAIFALLFFFDLAYQPPPQFVQVFVHELDDVERVENDLGLRQVLGHGGGVSPGHVHGDGLDLGAGTAKAPPERFQSFLVAALANIDDGAGVQI